VIEWTGGAYLIDDTYSVSTGPVVFTDDSSLTVPKGTLGLGALDGIGPGQAGRSPDDTSVLVTGAPLAGVIPLLLAEDQLGDPRPDPITDPGGRWTIGARQVGAAPVTSHTVTFDANGGSGTMLPQTASAPSALTANGFSRSGYSFRGWNTASDGSGTSYSNGQVYDFSADLTLYAQWSWIPAPPIPTPTPTPTPSPSPSPAPVPLPGPVAPGGSVLTVDGVPDPNLVVAANVRDDGLDVTGDGWSMTLDGLGPDGEPLQLGPDATLVLDAERDVRSTGTGFLPGSQVDVYMDPPVLLQTGTTGSWLRDMVLRAAEATWIGSFTVAADGTFSGEATLPEEIKAGEHVLQAVGISPTRQTRAVSLGVLVQPWIDLVKGRRTADGRYDRVRATGDTGGLDAGVVMAPFIRYRGQDAFTRGKASITVRTDGTFAWTRLVKKSKGLAAYVAYTDTTSNRVYWTKIR